MSTTPKLIDYKLLNEDIKIKILSEKLNKGLQKLQGGKPMTTTAMVTAHVTPPPCTSKLYIPKPRFYKKTSILFNLILGSVIIFVPFFLYYRYKHKPSKIEKDKKILDIVSTINNKIGLNPEYIKDFESKSLKH
jgi:H+/gluconate symporter-like permease